MQGISQPLSFSSEIKGPDGCYRKYGSIFEQSILAVTIPPAHPRGFALKICPHSGAVAS